MSTIEEQVSVILEPEGLYEDTAIETSILASSLSKRAFEVHQCRLGEERPYTEIPEALRVRVHGLFVFRHWVAEEDLALFPELRVIVRMGVGYDRLDRAALAKKGVIVCNCPDYGTTEVADHAIALALSLRRGVLLHHDLHRSFISKKAAEWTHYPTPLLQRPSAQRVFGVLGLGRIGTAVALRAKALGWSTVLFFDPYTANGMERALGLQRARTIEELFERSDTLSLHVPLTKDTRDIVNSTLVGRMKEGSVLINTARGRVLDLSAIEEGLRSGRLAGVGLDVLPDEPIPEKEEEVHPLIKAYRDGEEWLRGRMVITPHVAFYSTEAWDDIRTLSCETMRDVLLDGLRRNVIRPEDE
ncbi:hypothetical protein CPB86DRAFT_764131 [Serendipita vermifera]|nr:hypothetical protein CPB86DRAFT_764131 [Serendipita vermifera]